MTVAVPLAAIETLRGFTWGDFLEDDQVDALTELVAFAERFEPQPVPGLKLETVLVGEQRELRVETDLAFDLVRIGHDVFVPETVEVVDEEAELIHEAGNGNRLTVADVEAVAKELDDGAIGLGQMIPDASRLLRFLAEILAGDPLERACDGIASLTRKRDLEGGTIIVTFDEPGQSWNLARLLQNRLMTGSVGQ